MNDEPKPACPKCGAMVPADAPSGLCPACLMSMNLGPETEPPDGEGNPKEPVASPKDIGVHFPQLEVLEFLGRGGMGVVYKARQKSLNRVVALKLLAPERTGDPRFSERFAREAQALAALNHPNIVTVYDFGEAGGFFYLLMEFVDGVNLRQAMQAARFTPEQALKIVPAVCEALQYAHEHGIVHRDIKPENLLLDKDGRVKIADFGIAKLLHVEGDEPWGMESQPAGTPQYMAPEQKESGRTDHRADIYSLGVVLYELLTGELPARPVEPPSRKVRIDVRLDDVVLRALEREPERRYQQVSEFKTQLETIAATPPRSGNAPSPQRSGMGFGRRSRGALVTLAVAGAVALLVRMFFLAAFMAETGAAAPEVPRGSRVLVWKLATKFGPGDLVAYRNWQQVNLGRVVRSEPWTLVVRRNGAPDFSVPASAVIGKVVSIYWRGSAETTAPGSEPLTNTVRPLLSPESVRDYEAAKTVPQPVDLWKAKEAGCPGDPRVQRMLEAERKEKYPLELVWPRITGAEKYAVSIKGIDIPNVFRTFECVSNRMSLSEAELPPGRYRWGITAYARGGNSLGEIEPIAPCVAFALAGTQTVPKNGKRVLLDLKHCTLNTVGWGYFNHSLSLMKEYLLESGFEVDVNRENLLNEERLAKCNLLIENYYWSAAPDFIPYLDSELAAVRGFVEKGGALLLAACDRADVPECGKMVAAGNQLARQFGIEFLKPEAQHESMQARFSVCQKVTPIYFQLAVPLRADGSLPMISDRGQRFAALKVVGQGKVIAAGVGMSFLDCYLKERRSQYAFFRQCIWELTGMDIPEVAVKATESVAEAPMEGAFQPATGTKEKPFVNSLGMKFVPVPGTEVLFCIHETRWKDYAEYAQLNPGDDGEWKNQTFDGVSLRERHEEHPVVFVNWQDAKAFCRWLSEKEKRAYRLPTDREWSIAVGLSGKEHWSPNDTPANVMQVPGEYPWGKSWPPPKGAGNIGDESRKPFIKDPRENVVEGYNDGFPTTAPVMSFLPNKLGIYDLSGNVWEWCEDWYEAEQQSRVFRGGAWINNQIQLPSSFRAHRAPESPWARWYATGFRIVVSSAQPNLVR